MALTHLLTFDTGSLKSWYGGILESGCMSLKIHFLCCGLPGKKEDSIFESCSIIKQ